MADTAQTTTTNAQAVPAAQGTANANTNANAPGNENGSVANEATCQTCGRPVGPRIQTVSQVPYPPRDKLGNPGPLGLLGFAITTFVLGLYQCGAGLPNSNPKGDVGPDQAIFGLAVFMGGTAQFVAGIFEFRVGNTFGSTVHCSYGAFWLSYAMFHNPVLDIQGQYAGNMHAYSFALGIYLILWCFLTLIFFVAALRTNLAILAVFFFLTLAFLVLSIGEFLTTLESEQSVRVTKAGGALAVVDAFVAFYAGAAGLMRPETTFVRFPLGVIPDHWGQRFEKKEKA